MTLGDRIERVVTAERQESLPSQSGRYTETILYEVWEDPAFIGGPKQVLMSHETFLQFVGEVRRAREFHRDVLTAFQDSPEKISIGDVHGSK